MPALDENDLAARLRGLSAQQPAQPVDRVPAVRGRAGGIRRRRALAAGVAAVLVAGVPAGLLATRDTTPSPVVPASTHISAWPDRSLPGDQGIAQGVLRGWHEVSSSQPSNTPIRWLYRGEVTTGGTRPTYVAVFLAGTEGPGQQLVTAHAAVRSASDEVDGPVDEASSWIVEQVRLRDAELPVGLYLDGQEEGTNALFVLADPAARALSWTARALPYAPPVGTSGARRDGTASSPDGVFVADAGLLDGPVQVQVSGPALLPQAEQPLTTTGQPALVPPRPLVLPGYQQAQVMLVEQSAWQGETYRGDGSLVAGRYLVQSRTENYTFEAPAGPWAVHAVCYGGGRLRVAVMGQRGSVRCDGQQHAPFSVFEKRKAGGYTVEVEADTLLTYRLAVANGA